jgi:hypothetical protein
MVPEHANVFDQSDSSSKPTPASLAQINWDALYNGSTIWLSVVSYIEVVCALNIKGEFDKSCMTASDGVTR